LLAGLDGYLVEGTRKGPSRRCLCVNRIDLVGLDAAGEVGVGVYIGTDGINTPPELPTPIAPNQAHEELFLEG
jgi:hypothetical protein